jgi:hypothetical protein
MHISCIKPVMMILLRYARIICLPGCPQLSKHSRKALKTIRRNALRGLTLYHDCTLRALKGCHVPKGDGSHLALAGSSVRANLGTGLSWFQFDVLIGKIRAKFNVDS